MTTTQRFTPAGTNVRDTERHRQAGEARRLLEMDRHIVGFGSFVRFVDNNENVSLDSLSAMFPNLIKNFGAHLKVPSL